MMIEEAPEEIKKFRLSHVYEPLLIRWQRLGEHQNLFMEGFSEFVVESGK